MLAASAVLLSCAGRGEPPRGEADFVLVDKSARTLTLYRDGVPLKTYTGIQLGDAPVGHKHSKAMSGRLKAATSSTGAIRRAPITSRCASPIRMRPMSPSRASAA